MDSKRIRIGDHTDRKEGIRPNFPNSGTFPLLNPSHPKPLLQIKEILLSEVLFFFFFLGKSQISLGAAVKVF